MKREIKFRAWHNEAKGMLYEEYTGGALGWFQEGQDIEIMQFTGLLDKNDKEIYEGDIVKCHDHPTGVDDVVGEVQFSRGGFYVIGAMPLLSDYGTAWTEVIGNIYENPELVTP